MNLLAHRHLLLPSLPLALIGMWHVAMAQERMQPIMIVPVDSSNSIRLGFDRQLSTYIWNGSLRYGGTSDGFSYFLRQDAKTRIVQISPRAVYDEYADSLKCSMPFVNDFALEAQVQNSLIQDNRSATLGRIAIHQILSGFGYDVLPHIRLRAMGGYEINYQDQFHDQGGMYLMELDGRNLAIEEFKANAGMSLQQSYLGTRSPREMTAHLGMSRSFSQDVTDSLTLQYSELKRDFYIGNPGISGAQPIFSRDAGELSITNLLEYSPFEDTRVRLQTGFNRRTIDRNSSEKDFIANPNTTLDSKIEETEFFGIAQSSFNIFNAVQGDFQFGYREREELYLVVEDPRISTYRLQQQRESADMLHSISRRTFLGARLFFPVAENHLFSFAGSAGILRYDTPAEANTDDRDEALFTAGLRYDWMMNSSFSLVLESDARIAHLVYLSSVQSANNNWNRVIRFSPTAFYAPTKWFRTRTSAEVLANYTVYDYEHAALTPKSYSFRQAAWIDSTVIQMSNRIAVEFWANIRVYERGFIRWSDFKEKPVNWFLEQTYAPWIFVSALESFRFGVGFKYFSQSRYRYDNGERIFEDSFITGGPTAMVQWKADDVRHVSIEGWKEIQRQDGRVLRSLSNVTIHVAYSL
jgi:hypothetical protein